MIFTHIKKNHIYLVFQDFEDKINDIYIEVDLLPKKVSKLVKSILVLNFFSNNLERQKNYINIFSTYINDITIDSERYYLHVYILPKDLILNFREGILPDEKIEQIEHLSIKLFNLYTKIYTTKRYVELFENFNGSSFLQLESRFYINKLNTIYENLINYRINYKNKIVCSDKIIGIEIDELNIIEKNPLKIYQHIKSPFQFDLIKFIYSSICFLKEHRLQIFKDTCNVEYMKLLNIINKINNLLLKISTNKRIQKEKLTKETVYSFLKKNKNKNELKNNKRLFNNIESLFFSSLQSDVQLFISTDLSKVFEKLIEIKLSSYDDNLYIGMEDKHVIKAYNNKYSDLNNINYLLTKDNNRLISQYPDFLIKEKEFVHILDAKYKLKDKVLNSNDIRQMLTYSMLFNKKLLQDISRFKKVIKIILYVQKSNINMEKIDILFLNFEKINIFELSMIEEKYKESIFDTNISLVPIELIK